jgi:tetratricopeptide (TPR) repeat protein
MRAALATAVAIMALLGAGLSMSRADAAALVIGGGFAHSCYIYAQFHEDAREGVEVCTLALEQEPLLKKDRASTFVNRGVLYADLGDQSRALDDYNRATAVDLSLAQAYVNRSAALIAFKRYNAAVDDASKALSLGATEPEVAYYNRAVAKEALGDMVGAYHDFKQALSLAPGFTAASEQLKRFHVVSKPMDGT